jgi:type IV pilus assembly protein PilZ
MAGARSGILTLSITDVNLLHLSYMPFVQNGGLFISTNKSYRLGEEVFLLLTLMDKPDKIPVAGKIIWITPRGANGTRPTGIGIQFNEDSPDAKKEIETHLGALLSSDKVTSTL